jgi:chitinase
MTGADRLDVDVERTVPINLVADALTAVHRELGVALTVTVMVVAAAEGLAQDTMSLLRALATRGTVVTVNAMVMNFPAGQSWHDSLTAAAETVTDQISQVWPAGGRPGAYHRLGLTVMAGRNDTGVITTLDDARAVGQYANQHQIGFLGLWSLGRDNGGCPGQPVARHNCSGIAQGTFDFIRLLAKAVS